MPRARGGDVSGDEQRWRVPSTATRQCGTVGLEVAMSPEQHAARFASERPCILVAALVLLLAEACGHPRPAPQAQQTEPSAPLPPLAPDAPEFGKCHAGDAEACDQLGLFYQYGFRLPLDQRASRDYFGRACLAGKTRRCMLLAKDLEPSDPELAARMWRVACEADHVSACGALGDVLLDQGDPEAILQLRRACLRGEESYCPIQHSLLLFARCRKGDGRSCARLGACMKLGACATPNPGWRTPRPGTRPEKSEGIRI